MAATSSSLLVLLFSHLFTCCLLVARTLSRFATQLFRRLTVKGFRSVQIIFVINGVKIERVKDSPVMSRKMASTASQPSVRQSVQLTSEYDPLPHPTIQQIHVEAPYVPETKDTSVEDYLRLEDDGEIKSVYVWNLPASVTSAQLEQEFKRFNTIIHDGISSGIVWILAFVMRLLSMIAWLLFTRPSRHELFNTSMFSCVNAMA